MNALSGVGAPLPSDPAGLVLTCLQQAAQIKVAKVERQMAQDIISLLDPNLGRTIDRRA